MKAPKIFLLTVLALFLSIEGPWPPSALSEPTPKTILDLQPFSQESSLAFKDSRGREGLATLINLNPNINAWYLLRLNWKGSTNEQNYHLENGDRRARVLMLDKNYPKGLVISQDKERIPCDLWGEKSPLSLGEARKSSVPYAPLCDFKLYLRNPTKGHQTSIEKVTDFLRQKVPGGDEIVTLVKDKFFAQLYKEKAEEKIGSKPAGEPPPKTENAPTAARLDQNEGNRLVKPIDLGIAVQGTDQSGMVLGAWYEAKGIPGIFISVIMLKAIAPEIMSSYRKVVNDLNQVEMGEPIYLIAFDLDRFDLHYALGTVHPSVGWSTHIPAQMRDKTLPGPDGINTSAPLIRTGLVNPMDEPRTIATFTGGFKRLQGAFKYGPLALKDHGSHYGFMENGIIFSRLQPELATLFVLDDGSVDMKTWTEADNQLLPRIRYARQNGVPLIAGFDPEARMSIPGPWVSRWGPGNWSGSADEKLQAMRAGAALQESEGKRFLIYAFFWSATPSAMARVFQAYRCRYAMLLDMNALVHTYLAVYKREGANLYVQHLIRRMDEIDLTVKGRYIPRFLGYADDRDFFYLTRK